MFYMVYHQIIEKVTHINPYLHSETWAVFCISRNRKKKFALNLCCLVAAVFSHIHISYILHLSCYTMQHVIRFRKQTFFKSQLTVVSPCEKFLIDWVLMQYGEILQE